MLNTSTMRLQDIPLKEIKKKAHLVGTTWHYVYQIRQGVRNPSKAMAEKIAEVFGVPPALVMWPDSECCPCDRDQAANEP